MGEILVVEDEIVLARSIVSYLKRRGFAADYAIDAASARVMFQRNTPRLVILDLMTGQGDIDVAVRAMKAGARDFLVKPTPLASIASIARELMLDEIQVGLDRFGIDRIIGRSSTANALRASIGKLGRPVDQRPGILIMGPKGSGKTLAGITLHETASPGAPLGLVDCAVSDMEDLEETFNHAVTGTLLLRDVSKLTVAAQSKLLQLLKQSDRPPALVATTEKNLSASAAFSPDLLYRIQIGWIDIPPLIERDADVLLIADYFARRFARNRGEARPRFTASARAKLLEQDWPGNVAELENCIERAMLVQTDGVIDEPAIRAIDEVQTGEIPTLRELEIRTIKKALTRTRGNVSRAAEVLGVSRDTLRYRMEKFELSPR